MNFLYTVHYAFRQKDGQVIRNWSSRNVVARDAKQAISKARLSKHHIVEEVKQIAAIDVL